MQPRRFFRSIIVFVLLVVDSVLSQGQQLEGDECLLGDSGLYGECKKWDDCPGLNSNVGNSQQRPSICSFTQRSAIICCPITRIQRSNYTALTATPSSVTVTISTGANCTLRNGAQGECKSIQDCPRVVNSLRNGQQPILCEFRQSVPIICCPTNSPSTTSRPPQRTPSNKNDERRNSQFTDTSTTSSAVGAKSEAMCEYFSQFVFQVVQSPVLLVNAEFYNESFCSTREHTPNQAPLRDAQEVLDREFPHVASLGYGTENNTQWLCAGSLISERFILTTAHCITSPNNGKVRWIRVGDLNPRVRSANSQPIYTVEERIIHEGYRDSSPNLNDIALIKTDTDVRFFDGIARPACLYTRPGNPPGHKYATAVGWGRTHFNDTTISAKLMKKDLTLVQDNQCSSPTQRSKRRRRNTVRRRPESSKICVSDASPEPSSCVADVGSPLQIVRDTPYCMHAIVGLTSFGERACADRATPAIYTRVSDYVAWIENHVWP